MKIVLKIGIVLNYKTAEKKKDELYCVKSKEWLNILNNKEYNKYVITRNNKRCVPADVAIGAFLEHYNKLYQNENISLEIDYIHPDDISVQRFSQNHINYIIIYDLLESFHLNKKGFENYRFVLKNSPNVYPPYEYQKFINNKCTYYKYLAEKKIPVAPTHCITKEKWLKKDNEHYVNKILKKVKSNKWESIITKPVYGQESKDFAKFIKGSSEINKSKLTSYLSKNIPKYKSIVIQEYIPGFDKSNPEYRMYFIDGVYAYCVITTSDNVTTPAQEGGKTRVPAKNWRYLLSFSKKVMESLPKFNLPGNLKNPILTRIDIGSGLQGVPFTYFVNEVEFVPSLYIEDNNNFPVVEEIAKSLLEVAMCYYTNNLPIKVKF